MMAQPLYFGVDSSEPADQLFSSIVSRTNTVPEFWGRYLGAYVLTEPEAVFLHTKNCAIVPIWNALDNTDVAADMAWGQTHATRAVAAATTLGIPARTTLFIDIEGGWQPTPEFLTGYAHEIATLGYTPGFYGSCNQPAFALPYIAMRTAHPGRVWLWCAEPEYNVWQDKVIATWIPTVPAGHAQDCVLWQYSEGDLNDSVDFDLATDLSMLWCPKPVWRRRMALLSCALKKEPNHTSDIAMPQHIPAHGQLLDSGKHTQTGIESWTYVQYTNKFGYILTNNIIDIP